MFKTVFNPFSCGEVIKRSRTCLAGGKLAVAYDSFYEL